MPADAKSMEGVTIGGGITGKVQLKSCKFSGKVGGGGVDKVPCWRERGWGDEGGGAVEGCILRERS